MEAYQLLIVVPFLSFLLLLIFLQRWRSSQASTAGMRLPPSPGKLPIIGNLHQLSGLPHRSLHSLSKRYGHVMLLHFGRVPMLVASSAVAAREIMKIQDLIFSNRPRLSIPHKLMYGSRDVAFTPYGEYWRQVRSICVLHLLSNKRVQSFRRVREEETSVMVERIAQLGSASSSVVNLSDELMALTNDVICRVAFGRKYGDDDGVRRQHLKKILEEFMVLLATSPIKDYIPWLALISRIDGLDAKVERVAKFFDEFLENVVEEHRESKDSKAKGDDKDGDLVDILLEYQRENKDESLIEDNTIKAIIVDMFAAGTDTTSTTLNWTMTELLRNPIIMEKLQSEVRKVGEGKEDISEDDLEKMPYLKAVIKESLRLHPPLPLLVPRELTQDTQVMGFHIGARTQVVINVWGIGRDPSLWEDPEEFRPERFLNSSMDFRGLHFELLPFGAGRRGCPGVAFAVVVNELALAKLVHKFNFSLPNGQNPEDLDMSESPGITVHRRLPLFVSVHNLVQR